MEGLGQIIDDAIKVAFAAGVLFGLGLVGGVLLVANCSPFGLQIVPR